MKENLFSGRFDTSICITLTILWVLFVQGNAVKVALNAGMDHLKDILDKIIFGYKCQIITLSTFYQYIRGRPLNRTVLSICIICKYGWVGGF